MLPLEDQTDLASHGWYDHLAYHYIYFFTIRFLYNIYDIVSGSPTKRIFVCDCQYGEGVIMSTYFE